MALLWWVVVDASWGRGATGTSVVSLAIDFATRFIGEVASGLCDKLASIERVSDCLGKF